MGALFGSGLLSSTGLRSVALAGFAVTALALVAQLLEQRNGGGLRRGTPTRGIAREERRPPAVAAAPHR